MNKFVLISNKINKFNKKIEVSSDKSISIRCVLMASQAIGYSKIYNLLESEDVISAINAINSTQSHIIIALLFPNDKFSECELTFSSDTSSATTSSKSFLPFVILK